MLLNLLDMLKDEDGFSLQLCLHRGGVLNSEFKKRCPTIVLKPSGYKKGNFLVKLFKILVNRFNLFSLILKTRRSDIVFSNTIVNGKLLELLSRFNKNIITYVHELENVFRYYEPGGLAGKTLQYSKLFLYPSTAVRTVLQQNGVTKPLYKLNYFFPVKSEGVVGDERTGFLEKHKINGNFIVGGMGLASARKGVDLFLAVAGLVCRQQPGISFCWIGGFENETTKERVLQFIEDNGLHDRVCFTGLLPHSYDNFSAFDIFFLSSVEDPYPLVVLEAAYMNVPAIYFTGSGGIKDFVDEDAGWGIPDFRLQLCADRILNLYNHPDEIKRKGAAAKEKFMNWHANRQLILKQLDEAFETVLR